MVTYDASSINTVTTVTAGTGVTTTDTGTDGNHIYEIKSTGFSAMPGGRSIQLALPANEGFIQAPDNGYIFLSALPTAASDNCIAIVSSELVSLSFYDYRGSTVYTWVPVTKDQNVKIVYQSGAESISLKFIYANGSLPANP